jgi:hypothetical protein|tara:strand:- start:1303 stop:2172 length:870 start_codon:yes stop_codon:yes gene_type:complete
MNKMSLKLEEVVGKSLTEEQFDEAAGKKDKCYHKVKARYDVWPSAYASGALVKCRKVGAANWGNKSKKEGVNEGPQKDRNELALYMIELNKMLANAKILQKRKDPKAKIYIKMIQQDLKDAKKKLSKIKNESVNENKCLCEACWKGYEKKGMKKMFGKMYPNCVKKEGIKTTAWIGENEIYWENNIGESCGYTFEVEEDDDDLKEAEYQGRKVKLGKPTQGDAKKFKVYVKNDKGNVVKVNFGQGGDAKGGTMRIRKDNPKARKSFRARHNCDNPGPRHKARYWSCRKW